MALVEAESEASLRAAAPAVERIDRVTDSVGDALGGLPRVAPADAASVLFTSGSLGPPKAIVLEHRNIHSFATNAALPELREDDRVGQISSVSFDAFHFELWCTVAAGAEIVILPAVPDLPADFQRQLRRRRISAMLAPTMVVNHTVRDDREAFAPLRLLLAGGDVLLPSTCRDLFASGFGGDLYNLYGPAEITTACTAHRVTEQDAHADTVPIGRPLADLTPAATGLRSESCWSAAPVWPVATSTRPS
jgi:non-ribosomal peptide synthetase component F